MNEILNRYFEGETSLEEERRLKAYFSSGEVSEEHKVYNALFSFFQEESGIAYESEDSIALVLEKYFEGETSLEEEQTLKTYFSSDNVAEEHKIYTDLFACFKQDKLITYDGEDSIDLLLEKYFEGASSITEEQRLKSYFNSDEVTDEHRQFASLFNYYAVAQTEVLEKNIDINKAKTLHLFRRTMIGIAAGLALLLGSLVVMDNYNNAQNGAVLVQTQEEAEAAEALETTMEALAFLGIQLNKGTESLEPIKNLKKADIFKN